MSYTADEIDFLVAYIFPEDTWYIFPVAVVENRKALCLRPGSRKSKFERYREAWKLMMPASAESEPSKPGAAETHAKAVAAGVAT